MREMFPFDPDSNKGDYILELYTNNQIAHIYIPQSVYFDLKLPVNY